MTSKQHQLWIKRGEPFELARPLADVRDTLRAAGYTVYDIGNSAHLDHEPPEDHCPYSETGWPQKIAPYGRGFAIDIMPPPKGSGLPSLQVIGANIYADKQADRAPWLKYMNWGPVDDQHAVQDRWQPGHERRSSSDTGHIHLSSTTDSVDSDAAAGYNPIHSGGTSGMTTFNEKAKIEAVFNDQDTATLDVDGTDDGKGSLRAFPNLTAAHLSTLDGRVGALESASGGPAAPGELTEERVREIFREELAAVRLTPGA